jgi:Flp pilus assembly protein TadB
VSDAGQASVIIGGLALVLALVWLLAKWLIGAAAGHALWHWVLTRRRKRRPKR